MAVLTYVGRDEARFSGYSMAVTHREEEGEVGVHQTEQAVTKTPTIIIH